ncbi:MAG: fructosamine kinase family protein [Burkholderiaceae bacterium]
MSHLDPSLAQAVESAVRAALGNAWRLRAADRVGGGSIAEAWRLDATGGPLFLKTGAAAHPFDAEAQALDAIAATRTVRVPRPIAYGVAGARGFLVLEWIDLHGSGDWAAAGTSLAALHAATRETYGWHRDNAIGATPQFNAPAADWATFYRERRLRPQFNFARERGLHALAALEDAACRAADALLEREAPPASLLHGDLWRGNLAFDAAGRAVVFDPAAYWGDAETDLAMARLFGGFPEAFFTAYDAARQPRPGRRERLALYQIYHVLNHANLFGGGYVAQARALIAALIRAA